MKKADIFNIHKDSFIFLLNNSLRAIPFNILIASLLSIDLFFNGLSPLLISIWYFCITFLSLTRWYFTKIALQKNLYNKKTRSTLIKFFILTLLMGIAWGSCYLIFLPKLIQLQEFIIILVFGGLCAGSIASLSLFMPAYYAYIMPMFLPVIVYNYSLLDVDKTILATMFLLFIAMLSVIARVNKMLVNRTFVLSGQKEVLIHELEKISMTDSLTGLYNRRHFEEVIYEEFNRAKRNKQPLTLVSIDIDNFKLINDTFGHPFGDEFLISTANYLKINFQRANDIVFRLGGDEFAAIISNMSRKEILTLCNKLKENFKQEFISSKKARMHKAHGLFDKVTLSIGIAHIPFDSASGIESAVVAADEALYQAKEAGKNKIVLKEIP
jgi:diguanylate cyclase (GGDEF)-like protein